MNYSSLTNTLKLRVDSYILTALQHDMGFVSGFQDKIDELVKNNVKPEDAYKQTLASIRDNVAQDASHLAPLYPVDINHALKAVDAELTSGKVSQFAIKFADINKLNPNTRLFNETTTPEGVRLDLQDKNNPYFNLVSGAENRLSKDVNNFRFPQANQLPDDMISYVNSPKVQQSPINTAAHALAQTLGLSDLRANELLQVAVDGIDHSTGYSRTVNWDNGQGAAKEAVQAIIEKHHLKLEPAQINDIVNAAVPIAAGNHVGYEFTRK